MALLEEDRNKDYTRRVFNLADYAKEKRLTNMAELMVERFQESGERNLVTIESKWEICIHVWTSSREIYIKLINLVFITASTDFKSCKSIQLMLI